MGLAAIGKKSDLGPQWFILETARGYAPDLIKTIQGRNIEVFMPLERRITRHARREVMSVYPMIPGYVFTRFDLLRDDWEDISTLPDAGKFLGIRVNGDGVLRPSAARPGEIELLQNIAAQADQVEAKISEMLPQLNAKTLIEIHGRILAGATGTVIHDYGGRVLLDLDKQFGGKRMSIQRESVRERGRN